MNKAEWLKEYYKISKRTSKHKALTKKEALSKVYEVKGNRHKKRFQGTIKVPICLMGCKVKLVEKRGGKEKRNTDKQRRKEDKKYPYKKSR